MVVKNFYVPADVSDFLDSTLLKELEKANNRASRQIQQDLENKLEWSSQVEAADGGKTALATAQKFLQTAGQVGSAVSTFKENKQKKTAKEKKEDLDQFNILFPGDTKEAVTEYSELAKTYQEGKDKLSFNDAFKKALEANKGVLQSRGITSDSMEEAFNFLKDADPSRLLNIQEFAAVNYTSRAITDWQNDGTAQEQYKGDYQHWLRDQLQSKYNLSNEALAGLITPQAERQSQTVAGTRGAVFAANQISKGNLEFINNLDVATKNSDPNAVTKVYAAKFTELKADFEAKGFLPQAAAIKSREKIKGLINSTIWRGNYGTHELNQLKAGIVQGVPQGSGPNKEATGYDLLTVDDFKFLEGQVTAYNEHIRKADIAIGEGNITAAMVGVRNGTINSTTGKPWEQKDIQIALERAKDLGVSTDSKIYKQAENFNPAANTKDVYKIESETIKPIFLKRDKAGRTTQLAEVTNPTLKTELGLMDQKINKYDSDIDFNGDYSGQAELKLKTVITGKIDEVAGLSESQELMKDIIDNKYNEFKNEVVLNSPKGTSLEDMTLAIKTKLDNYLIGNGFGSEGGIYSATNDGQFPGIMIKDKASIELKTGNNPAVTHNQLTVALKKHKTVIGVIQSGDAITNAEFASLQLNKGNEMTGKWEGLTQDIILKAEVLGVSPIVLVKAKAEALKNSSNDADKIFYEAYNVESFTKNIPKKDPYKDLNTYITEVTGNKVLIPGLATNLLYASERINPNNWTPNMMKRLIELEQTLNPKPKPKVKKQRTKEEIDKERKKLEKQLKNIQENQNPSFEATL